MAEVAGARYKWQMGIEARMLTILTAGLLAFGLATVYSASSIVALQDFGSSAHFVLRQMTGVIAGLLVFAVAAKIDAERWSKWAWPIMLLSIFLLLFIILPFTTAFSPRINGSRRFLFGGSVQPSEFAKLAVVVWTSMLIVKKGTRLRKLRKGLLPFIVVISILNLLVWLEPDLSAALFFSLQLGVVLFAGGVRVGHFILLGLAAIPFVYAKAQKLQYVMLRMSSFLDPGSGLPEVGYQTKQSLIAVGSGGLLGVGYGAGRQQYGFLPYAYDDFIGGNIGEEWGFMGLFILTLAFALYTFLGFRIARQARSQFQQLLAVGLTFTTAITAYVHLGVAISLLPNTGLTLPFISYGRSNLILTLLMTGILVNIGSTRERVMLAGATNPLNLDPVQA